MAKEIGGSRAAKELRLPESGLGDLRETDWFYSAVQYVYEHEMMSGVTPSYFDPEWKMTRAMLVSVFYRMRGGPAVSGVSVFPDVPAGTWFTDAVIWAVNEGVVSGYGSGLFGPNDNITREQLAVIYESRDGFFPPRLSCFLSLAYAAGQAKGDASAPPCFFIPDAFPPDAG